MREVVEKRWSLEISSPSISNSNETRIYRSESLPASACSFCSRHTRPPSCLMGSFGTKPSETYDRRRKGPQTQKIKCIWCENVAVFHSMINITDRDHKPHKFDPRLGASYFHSSSSSTKAGYSFEGKSGPSIAPGGHRSYIPRYITTTQCLIL